jgi:hypothetical protein
MNNPKQVVHREHEYHPAVRLSDQIFTRNFRQSPALNFDSQGIESRFIQRSGAECPRMQSVLTVCIESCNRLSLQQITDADKAANLPRAKVCMHDYCISVDVKLLKSRKRLRLFEGSQKSS